MVEDQERRLSPTPTDQLIRPVVSEGKFSYEKVNVIVQRRDPDSLLNWVERAIRMRKECPEIGWGKWAQIETDNPAVFAHRCWWQDGEFVAVHNLSREACSVSLTLDLKHGKDAQWFDLLDDRFYNPIENPKDGIKLEGYGYRWFRVGSDRL